MLQKIGNRTKTVLGFLLFIPIIGSFLLWGISDMLRAAGVVRYAATVGNTTISTQEFARDYRREVDGLKRQGVKASEDMLHQLGVSKQVLRNDIERELLRLAARDTGIVISDKTVAEEIQKEKVFADDSGKFSKEKFKAVIANAGMSENEFVGGLRDDMAIRTLVNAITASAQPPAALPAAIYGLDKTKYTADVYTLSHSAMSGSRAPTDKELGDYYAAHKDMYQVPELRRGLMATLSVRDFETGLQPTDADLKALYDAKKVDFSIPEERSVQFVSVPDEAHAKTIAERARSGEKLSAVATAVMGSNVPLKNMNDLRAGTLPPNLDAAIFKLPRGETSEPVNTQLGWYVLQITNIKPGVIPPMDKVKDRLIITWRQEQTADALPKFLDKLDDAIAGGETLENLAATYHLKLRQIPLVDANGNGAEDLSGDENAKPAVAAMFKQKQGEVGNAFELPGGDYGFARTDEVRPQHIPALADIKDKVIADWKKSNQSKLAEELAQKFASDWRKSDNISAMADKIGAELSTKSDISRAGDPQKLTAVERAVLKTASVGDVTTTTDGKAEYIIKIRAITPPAKTDLADAALTQTRAEATQAVKNDYLQIFLNALEKRYPVEVNEKAVKQIESSSS